MIFLHRRSLRLAALCSFTCGRLSLAVGIVGLAMASTSAASNQQPCQNGVAKGKKTARIFMVGDVMLGRGVDQMLQHHVDPVLFEGYMNDARDYLALAVAANGPLPPSRPVDYVWGDAKKILTDMHPDVKIINLETAVTAAGEPWPHKGINYRMHPGNVQVIKSVNIDCCILANNHTLDWGYSGLKDTLKAITSAGIKVAGAGMDRTSAESPAVFPVSSSGSRVLVFAAGSPSAGVPHIWRATENKSGVHFFDENSTDAEIRRISELVKRHRKPGDLVVMSLHWGGNWGFDPEEGQQEFARALIDDAEVDVVYGHSSHHIKGVEIYKGKLIVYGCGDFLSDYEGIKGDPTKDSFRDDLSFMYFLDVRLDDGRLAALTLHPMRLKRMSVHRADQSDRRWLFDTMRRETRRYGSDVIESPSNDGSFQLVPPGQT